MTFAPMNQTLATLQALQTLGVELPNVSTKIVVPYEDTVYVMLDMSEHMHLLAQTRATIPVDFTCVNEDNPVHVGSTSIFGTRVTFRLYEYDQDFSA